MIVKTCRKCKKKRKYKYFNLKRKSYICKDCEHKQSGERRKRTSKEWYHRDKKRAVIRHRVWAALKINKIGPPESCEECGYQNNVCLDIDYKKVLPGQAPLNIYFELAKWTCRKCIRARRK